MSRARRIAAVGVAAASVAVAAIGCGGGPEEVDADELVEKGDEICREGQERFEQIQSDAPANANEAVDQTDLLIQESEDELNALRDLEPPDELRESFDRYLEARGRALEYLRRGRDAADAQDSEAYLQAQQGVAKRARERRDLAEAVGFQVCSRLPES
jgi:hypothetical protein